ncbi:hypothetical protein NPIL_271351, partial [Nephila pilipes]
MNRCRNYLRRTHTKRDAGGWERTTRANRVAGTAEKVRVQWFGKFTAAKSVPE